MKTLNFLMSVWATSPVFILVAGAAGFFMPPHDALLVGLAANLAAACVVFRRVKDAW